MGAGADDATEDKRGLFEAITETILTASAMS
jgi:hypothetical protein